MIKINLSKHQETQPLMYNTFRRSGRHKHLWAMVYACTALQFSISSLTTVAQTPVSSYGAYEGSPTQSTVTNQPGHVPKATDHNNSFDDDNRHNSYYGQRFVSGNQTSSGTMRYINGFGAGGNNYVPISSSSTQPFTKVNIARVDNDRFTGDYFVGFYESSSVRLAASPHDPVPNGNVRQNNTRVYLQATQQNTMESMINNYSLSYGVDNLFSNRGTGNAGSTGGRQLHAVGNNIERVDLIYQPGVGATTTQGSEKVGFLINERGGNDNIRVAPILALGADGNPSSIGDFKNVSNNQWGKEGPSYAWACYSGPYNGDIKPHNIPAGPQQVSGVYVSLADLGVPLNTKVYGLAIFSADFPDNANKVTLEGTPTNTDEGSSAGGLDLIAGNFLSRATDNFDLVAQTITGRVWNDANGNGTAQGGESNVSGTNESDNGSIPAGDSLFVNIIDPATGEVVGSVPVNADGTYSYNGMLPNFNYTLQLSSTRGTNGETAPDGTLPEGWAHTAKNLDGNVDDQNPGLMSFTSPAEGDLANHDFGLNRTPESYDVSNDVGALPARGESVSLQRQPMEGSDPEDGPDRGSWSGKSLHITSLPPDGHFTLIYNGQEINETTTIENYDPALLTIRRNDSAPDDTETTSFQYAVIDEAGTEDPTPATYTVNFSGALPVGFGPITATLEGNNLLVTWSTEWEAGNDHFEIELSNDGKSFTTIGSVKSKGSGGNSDKPLKYELNKPSDEVASMMGLVWVILPLCLLLLLSKRNRVLFLGMYCVIMSSIGAVSCNKKNIDVVDGVSGEMYVRIKQIDTDGSVRYSKIVKVVKK